MAYTLGLIGAGNMATAIVTAALRAAVLEPRQLIAADPSPERREAMKTLGVKAVDDLAQVARASDQVLLAVKPQAWPEVARDLAAHVKPEHVLVSVMAGVTTARLAADLAEHGGAAARIVRVMPNTPMLVGQGMAAVALGADARPGDDELTMRMFQAGGKAIRIDERHMDAVTAVSGSGPAYLFYLAEAMQRAAGELGLGEHGRTLVSQTLVGAAHLLAESPDTASELKRKVMSPGGTTEAAISQLDREHVSDAVVAAIAAAAVRSRELGA
ncbi:MAG: pyrroline-5-carboxylate reductase [Phycisphaeraceae bacterium]